ncbi:MAG: hypothetical protein ACOYEQ_08980 [Bacillota bacterium]|jgi:hypothetical protein
MNIKKVFTRKPPIWETPEWDNMSWDEKMAMWQRHRKINLVLGSIFIVCFLGSLMWYIRGRVLDTAGRYDLAISIGIIAIMAVCLYAARNLMD